MAAGAVTAPTLRSSVNGFVYQDDVTVNSNQSFQLSWAVPSLDGSTLVRVDRFAIQGSGAAATLHDIHADGEFVTIEHYDPSANALKGVHRSYRIHYHYRATGTTPFTWEADGLYAEVCEPGDTLIFYCPPFDDNGAPTADMRIVVGVSPVH